MHCPACQGPLQIAEEEKGYHARCGSPFCPSADMQEGQWALTAQDAYEILEEQWKSRQLQSA